MKGGLVPPFFVALIQPAACWLHGVGDEGAAVKGIDERTAG